MSALPVPPAVTDQEIFQQLLEAIDARISWKLAEAASKTGATLVSSWVKSDPMAMIQTGQSNPVQQAVNNILVTRLGHLEAELATLEEAATHARFRADQIMSEIGQDRRYQLGPRYQRLISYLHDF